MSDPAQTPLRELGVRTPEGWHLVGDADGAYHDGIEDRLYEMLSAESDLRSTNSGLMALAQGRAEAFQLDPSRANIVRGLDIPPDAHVLEIGAGLGAVTRWLGEQAALVDAVEPAVARARVAEARTRDLPGVSVFVGSHLDVPASPTYDIVVVVGVLEHVGDGSADPEPYIAFLRHLQSTLKPGGTLALAIENKLGVKYLVGAPEGHSDVVFDSIEGYPSGGHARTFSRRELEMLFEAAGLVPSVRIAFPDHKVTRAVLDAPRLERDAPGLLHNLPSFPSVDHRTPRPRLADEAHVWRSLVDAGLGAETGNSFLVLAGKGGPQTLWADSLAAVYYSRSRRENYSFEKRVEHIGGELSITRRRVGRPDPGATVDFTEGRESVVAGVTLQEAAEHLSVVESAALLRSWRAALLDRPFDPDHVPFDFVPNNIVLGDDGALTPIDQEWTVAGWSTDRVIRRGVFWFVAQLVRNTSPQRWVGFATVRDVLVAFGAALGLDSDGAWIDLAISEESELLAEVGVRMADETPEQMAARLADGLRSMVSDALTDLPLGDRLPDILTKVQGYLTVAEATREHLGSQLDEQQRAAAAAIARVDGAEEQARAALHAQQAAEAAKVAAERATLAAENMRAIFADRTAVAEDRYHREHARADGVQAELAMVRGSRAYRLVSLYYRVLERLAPAGTRRRRLYGRTGRALARVLRRLRPVPVPPAVPVVLPISDTPLVSIVIPVHGKWDYTERCLRAVAATAGEIAFETIVVDDASPDGTLARLRDVQGIRVVALDPNRGFVGACNAGIEAARGEYVVLLNNDTRVDPQWLVPLVETVQEPGVGLVGSRLVYPDGRLQEAGGIIFSDGSGWNFGKFEDPESPAYTYRRDVDYCSAASVIVSKAVLDEIGNLDTRFSPAYYDDVDLAFSVRKLGLRVVYQPASVVIHDEGVSNGTDETSGIKAYQVINKEKFVEKWRTELVAHYEPGAQHVALAARRGQGERIVVVIDHYVPRPDEDAGSVRMMAMLTTLRELGYGVLFVPDNRVRTEPWTTVLAQLGVEVFHGHGDLPRILRQLALRVQAVIVSRVTVATNYVVTLRALLPGVPVVFDTVDLHFLREERAAEVAGRTSPPPIARTLRSLELALVESSDTTIVVSSYEQELLTRLVPGADVRVLPTTHAPVDHHPSPSGRAGLLFVGSFVHPPNADGLRWFFTEVYPLLEARLPGVRVTVVGREPAPDLVASAPAAVTFLGWVQHLTPLYDSVRVSIAPLRFGAGVKGKIGEAMVHGVPVVMTPIGAEGMSIEAGEHALVATDAVLFAEAVFQLLTDDDLWRHVSKAGSDHVDALFGPRRFRELLAAILEPRP